VKKAAIALAATGGGVGAYLVIAKKYNLWPFQLPPAPPPGQFILTIKSKASTTEVSGVAVTVDGQSITTPGSATMDAGSYTIVAPETIVDEAGVSYSYQSYEVT
jgi:hypothetical protein